MQIDVQHCVYRFVTWLFEAGESHLKNCKQDDLASCSQLNQFPLNGNYICQTETNDAPHRQLHSDFHQTHLNASCTSLASIQLQFGVITKSVPISAMN